MLRQREIEIKETDSILLRQTIQDLNEVLTEMPEKFEEYQREVDSLRKGWEKCCKLLEKVR